jgi:hypothetical protein
MDQVWTKVLELVLSGDDRWTMLGCVVGLLCLWAVTRAVTRAKKFRLVIEYIAGDK